MFVFFRAVWVSRICLVVHGTTHNSRVFVTPKNALSLTPLASGSISGVWYGRSSGDREQTAHRTYSSPWHSNNSVFWMCFPRTGSAIVTNTLCNYFLRTMAQRRVQHSARFAIKLDFRSIFPPHSPPSLTCSTGNTLLNFDSFRWLFAQSAFLSRNSVFLCGIWFNTSVIDCYHWKKSSWTSDWINFHPPSHTLYVD